MAATAFLDSITLDELERDPYPVYERLRREAPVAFVPAADVWFVTRFDDCEAVGSGKYGFVGAKDHPTLQRVFGDPNVLTTEGEDHDDLRRGIDPSLQPSPVNDVVERIVRPIAIAYLEKIRSLGEADLVSAYFEPVSVEALRSVMGLDGLVDADTLRRWFADLNAGIANFGLEEAPFALADAVSAEIATVLEPLFERVRATPDDSMISHMLWAGVGDGAPRPIAQIMPSIRVILLGGMQEPGHAASSTLLGLLSERDQLALLYDDPDEWIPAAVNEGLRWIAPIGAVERQATQDVELRGQYISAGSIVQVVLGSANRDETRFDEPHRFDMRRQRKSHQAFGNGSHFCAGHFFARQVERIMFEELVRALPGLRIAPGDSVETSGWVFRAPKKLVCQWDAQAVVADVPEAKARDASGGALHARRNMRIRSMTLEAEGVIAVELQAADGGALPRWLPGSHVDVLIRGDQPAQYSLCGSPNDARSYRIAVLREPQSRGASSAVHGTLRPGDEVIIGDVRNTFALEPAAEYVFVAGGIGITPILPMIEAVRAMGLPWSLHYCGRSRNRMAFVDSLVELGDAVRTHIPAEGTRLRVDDLFARIAAQRTGAVVYACGPTRLLADIEAASERWGVEVRLEHFDGAEAHRDGDRAFLLRVVGRTEPIEVGADETALDAVTREGFEIRRSCLEGNCGSCEVAVRHGRVDHRDLVLTKGQRARNDRMMLCVSRALDDELEIEP